MRILLIIRDLERAGAQRQLVELAKGLSARGHTVNVAILKEGGSLVAELRSAHIKVIPPHKGRGSGLVPTIMRLVQAIWRQRPDVVYGFMPLGSLVSLILPTPSNTVRLVGIRGSNRDWRDYRLVARMANRLVRELSARADVVIANSHAGKHYFESVGRANINTVVIPNGIDVVRFMLPDRTIQHGVLPSKKPTRHLAILARMHPMKGRTDLLQALLHPDLSAISWTLHIVGKEGPATAAIYQMVNSTWLKERVEFWGEMEDPRAVYQTIDYLILPSKYGEGFSNVLGEAMATGVPCIATDVGDAPRILGSGGWIVQPGDVTGLRVAIYNALELDCEAYAVLSDEVQWRIRNHYSSEVMLNQTEALIDATIRNSPRNPDARQEPER